MHHLELLGSPQNQIQNMEHLNDIDSILYMMNHLNEKYDPIYQLQPDDLFILENFEELKVKVQEFKQAQAHSQAQQPSLSPSMNMRCKWSESQQKCFFKILATHILQNSNQYLNWKKGNKKKVFTKMSTLLGTKTSLQCRLKFNSYKRKHSNKKKLPQFYEKCMKDLIIKKLGDYASSDIECRQILYRIVTRDRQLEQYIKREYKESRKQKNRYKLILKTINSKYMKFQDKIKKEQCQSSLIEELEINIIKIQNINSENKTLSTIESEKEEQN